ncbi:protein kinase [Streptomyces sp. NPDC058470]|uniref:protein kinase domain-containing protein n=1 Tax=Streptomyces sp. NPDC058470 TaxID=3346515 RepID=UPI0036680DD7
MSDEGRLIADRYRILDRIGRGGMATVWRAHDDLLGREVAVKKLHPQPHLDADELATLFERTRREARSTARISHPNVVVVHDVVEDEGLPIIVMEYVPSTTLADLIKAHGPVPPEEAARIGRGVLAALRAAHRAGVLHRDVKPANVLLANDGRVVLTDFGIAQATETSTLTRTGQLVGSIDFMAPERLVGGPPGPEADLWALGATLFQAVEGRSPFLRDTAGQTMYAIAMEPAPAVLGAGPLTPLIEALLVGNPADRMSAEDAERLLRTVDADPERIRRVGSSTTPPAARAAAAADAPAPAPAPAPAAATPAAKPDPKSEPSPNSEPSPASSPSPNSARRPRKASAAGMGAPAAERPQPATTDPQAPRPSGGRNTRTSRTSRTKKLVALAVTVATATLITISLLINTAPEKNTSDATASSGPLPVGGTTPSQSANTPTASSVSSSPSSSTASSGTSSTAHPPSQQSTPKAGQEGPAPEPGDENPTTDSGSDSSVAPATGHTLVVAASGKCLSSGAGTEGIQLIQATCNGSAAQRWQVGSNGSLRSSGKCMTVAGGATDDRTEIQLSGCSGDASQQFHLSGTELLADQSQKCVDIFGGESGTGAVLWECNGRDNQTWTIG